MPSIFRKTVDINKGTYAMWMEDGQNAEITMYGQIVSQRPRDWWTGKPREGDYIVQSEFMKDLDSMSRAKSLTIRMNSLGGDAGVSILIHNRLREIDAIAALYDPALVEAAKYRENPCTAQELAYRAAANAAGEGKAFLAAMSADAQAAAAVGAAPAPVGNEPDDNSPQAAAAQAKADDVDASGEAAVTAVAYRTGHLNSRALIVAEEYTLTQADKEELRKGGILLSEMLD